MEFRPENQRIEYWNDRVFYKFYNSALYNTKYEDNFKDIS